MKYPVIVIFFPGCFAICCNHEITNLQNTPNPPNIIFILTDDHRYDTMGIMNHPHLETPCMDKTAREGIYFTQAFATTSLCSPGRASVLSGMYAHNHWESMTLLPDKGEVYTMRNTEKSGQANFTDSFFDSETHVFN